jgi:hypothetical protein
MTGFARPFETNVQQLADREPCGASVRSSQLRWAHAARSRSKVAAGGAVQVSDAGLALLQQASVAREPAWEAHLGCGPVVVGPLGVCPGSAGAVGLLGVFAGNGTDPRPLLGGDCARRTWPRSAGEQFAAGLWQSGGVQTSNANESVEGLSPARTPQADRMALEIDLGGDLFVAQAGAGQVRFRPPGTSWCTSVSEDGANPVVAESRTVN